MEKLRLGCKDFEENKRTYILLARIYNVGKKTGKHFTQRQLINMAYDVGYKLTEATLRKYIKEERSK